eukprot:12886126-Prorocentrum_lima.AAC.1
MEGLDEMDDEEDEDIRMIIMRCKMMMPRGKRANFGCKTEHGRHLHAQASSVFAQEHPRSAHISASNPL